jgi:acyl-coenzyme A synthetase/AMP-(fatty) acid ligase
MTTPPQGTPSIRDRLASAPEHGDPHLTGAAASVALGELRSGTSLGGLRPQFAGRSVLVATRDQFAGALALIELDGIARRVIVCTPNLPPGHLPGVIEKSGADAIVYDGDLPSGAARIPVRVRCDGTIAGSTESAAPSCLTEWVLLTSGTTGAPKLVVHTTATLTPPANGAVPRGDDVVWGTFYDIRRYGGLQILLRAVLGGASLVLAGPDEPVSNYLTRLAAHGATHVSGTPSHWRRVLMTPGAAAISPRYIRLSGEIADQSILDALRSSYPGAHVSHAYASTEAGVGFDVDDGLEGFPASVLAGHGGDARMKVENGSLRVRSPRTAIGYLGEGSPAVADPEGFVDTGDIVERRGDRFYFLGRRSGIINVGGLKVYPEEVEAAINRHPEVRMSRVQSRKNPIIGSLVAADVVLKLNADATGARVDLKRQILRICREILAAHKVPVTIRFVPSLELAAAGKIARSTA